MGEARYGGRSVEFSWELFGPVSPRCDRPPFELPPGKAQARLMLLWREPSSLPITEPLVAESSGDVPPSAPANPRVCAVAPQRLLPTASARFLTNDPESCQQPGIR